MKVNIRHVSEKKTVTTGCSENQIVMSLDEVFLVMLMNRLSANRNNGQFCDVIG